MVAIAIITPFGFTNWNKDASKNVIGLDLFSSFASSDLKILYAR